MLIRSTLAGAAAALVTALAAPALAGPEVPGYYPSGKTYEEYAEEPYYPGEYEGPELYDAPAPAPLLSAPVRGQVAVHVQVSGCAPCVARPVAPLLPVAVAPPVVSEYRYEVRHGYAAPPAVPVAVRPAATWIKGHYGPRPYVPGWY